MTAARLRTRFVGAVVAGSMLVSCAGRASVDPPIVAASPSSPLARSVDVRASSRPAVTRRTLEALFGARAGAATPDLVNPEDYRAWVWEQLARPELYELLLPLLEPVDQLRPVQLVGRVELREGRSRRKGPFYYRVKPCAESELVAVRPWWKSATEVLVCRDDYRPAVRSTPSGQSCDTTEYPMMPESGCGCGPSLMFCGTRQLQQSLRTATREELQLTLREVIVSRRPFGEMLTMNETVRSGMADLFYARVRYFLTGAFDPPDVDRPPSLRPRDDVFKGGILSTPTYLYSDGQRTLVSLIWSQFLGVPLRSQAVGTHELLAVTRGQRHLRGASLMFLTETVGCRNCHARLEYGQLAMSGWMNGFAGMHFVPPAAPATTRFYVRNHLDLRTEGPADLGWLGRTIGGQPEFRRSVVSRIVAFVFEGMEVVPEVVGVLEARFGRGQDLAALIEDAVVVRAFGTDALHPAREMMTGSVRR